ncbi:unnamed protein product [Fusarium graminearum]|nr:unnamed protein product [Fusarium graminearum]
MDSSFGIGQFLGRAVVVVCFPFLVGAVDGGETYSVCGSADGMAASSRAEESLGENLGEDGP